MAAQSTRKIDAGPDEFLFDPHLLDRISNVKNDPTNSIYLRPLSSGDYDRGFTQLLGQLTKVGDVSREQYLDRFRKMKASGDYYVIVAEDRNIGKIIASATLVTEQKFIHNCALRGRLEDVVVNDQYRGKSLGQIIVNGVVFLAKRLRCYKLSLDCRDNLIRFYERLGFSREPGNANSLNLRFENRNTLTFLTFKYIVPDIYRDMARLAQFLKTPTCIPPNTEIPIPDFCSRHHFQNIRFLRSLETNPSR